MCGFINKRFFYSNNIFDCNALKYVSINMKQCIARPEIINISSNEPLFYPYSIRINKCSGSCNDINDPYAKVRVSDV